MPKVSIIIPTHNREKFIREAVDSVLIQTYQDFEIIVIDDGSTDKTREIIEKYQSQYPEKLVYIYQKNQGVSAARNKGINMANGKYIAFLDSDDVWMPNKLEKLVPILDIDNNIGLVFTKTLFIDNRGDLLGYKSNNLTDIGFESLLCHNYIITSSVLTTKQVINNVGLFNLKYSIAEDYDVWLKIASNYKIFYINTPLVKYRNTPNGLAREDDALRLNHIEILSKYLSYSRKKINKILAQEYYFLSKWYFKNKMFIKAFYAALNSVSLHKYIGKSFWNKGDSLFGKLFKLVKPYFLVLSAGCLSLFNETPR